MAMLFCTKCTCGYLSTRNFINKRQPSLFPNNMCTHTERIKAINLDHHECKLSVKYSIVKYNMINLLAKDMENINSCICSFFRVYSAVCQLRYCFATPSFIYSDFSSCFQHFSAGAC